jgi:hypothetical protein
MSAIVPFSGAQLPAYLKNRASLAHINKEVAVGAAYGRFSIKGKVFCLVKDGEKKMLMRPDEPDEVAQSVNLAVIRANTKARSFYGKSFVEGESDGARPTCFSYDGVAPNSGSEEPQCNKCQICPQAVWGSKTDDKGQPTEGTACSPHTRMAVIDPDKPDVQLLLSVPAASRKNFSAVVKAGDGRGIPYNAMVLKVGFDPEAASPKLTFKPIGLLSDEVYSKVNELYGSEIVMDICGLNQAPAAPALAAPPEVDTSELDAALAAKEAVSKAAKPAPAKVTVKAAAKPAPAPTPEDDFSGMDAAPAPTPAPAPVKAAAKPAAPAPVASADMDNLLGELGDLLGNPDD